MKYNNKLKDTGRSKTIDILQQEVKELKSRNRHLERELKKSHQSKGISKDNTNKLLEEDYDEKDKENVCSLCAKGKITKTSIGPRIIIGCTNNCGYGEIIKNEK